MVVLRKSWGGHGEHGELEISMDPNALKLTLTLTDSTYSDWGGAPQLVNQKTATRTFDVISKNVTKSLMYRYIDFWLRHILKINDYKITEDDIIL